MKKPYTPTKEQLAIALQRFINKKEVFCWGRSPDDRPGGKLSFQIDAVAVVMNGPFIQIELDPTRYRIVEIT